MFGLTLSAHFPLIENDHVVDQRGAIVPDDVDADLRLDPGSLFAGSDPRGEIPRVMDFQQEAIAKGLGEGHRVLRGVAGSGKTMILVF